MPRPTPRELRENSRSARRMAAKEADSYFKGMWASHALALDQLAEKIERGEVAARQPGDAMPPDDDSLETVGRLLAEAARPVLVLGTDVWADGAEEAALRFLHIAPCGRTLQPSLPPCSGAGPLRA